MPMFCSIVLTNLAHDKDYFVVADYGKLIKALNSLEFPANPLIHAVQLDLGDLVGYYGMYNDTKESRTMLSFPDRWDKSNITILPELKEIPETELTPTVEVIFKRDKGFYLIDPYFDYDKVQSFIFDLGPELASHLAEWGYAEELEDERGLTYFLFTLPERPDNYVYVLHDKGVHKLYQDARELNLDTLPQDGFEFDFELGDHIETLGDFKAFLAKYL